MRLQLEFSMQEPRSPAGRRVVDLLTGGTAAGADDLAELRSVLGEHPADHANLMILAMRSGAGDTAAALAAGLTARAPGCIWAWLNASVVFALRGEIELAVANAERAHQCAPRDAHACWNLGVLCLGAGDVARAAPLLSWVATAHPDVPIFHAAAGKALFVQGDIAGARAALLRAVEVWARTPPHRVTTVTPVPGRTISIVPEALEDAADALDAAGIAYFLIAGTLLGIVRDGALIKGDKDADIAVDVAIPRRCVLEAFERSGRFDPLALADIDDPERAFSVVHHASRCSIDVFAACFEPSGVRFPTRLDGRLMMEARMPTFAIGHWRWRDRDWPVPQPPERYLEGIYGPRWREPDPYFDTVLSNPSRTPETLPFAISAGLLRLCSAMDAGNVELASALCTQLLARESFDSVERLRRALDTVVPGKADG